MLRTKLDCWYNSSRDELWERNGRMGIKWKSELEYGTSGNYEDEDDSSLMIILKIQVSVSQLITKK
jgi:hypothetical protein